MSGIRLLPLTVVAAVLAVQPAQAADFTDSARVLSSTPIIERVREPRQECMPEAPPQRAAQAERSVIAPIIGGVAGALLGSTVGRGSGRDAATAAGAIVGTIVGDRVANPETERSAAGSVVGGVAGGLLGAQVGNGNGRTAAAAAGAIAGAVLLWQSRKRSQMQGQKAKLYVRTVSNYAGNSSSFVTHATTWQDFTLLGVTPGPRQQCE